MKIRAKDNKRLIIAKIGKIARRLLLVPLAATILHGCVSEKYYECHSSHDECCSHNETTIKLNRPTDGTVASIDELKKEPPAGVLMTEPLIKFINEAYAVSSSGMPQEAYVTQVPEYCFTELGGANAYAIPEYTTVYIRGPIRLYIGLDTLDHEMGHLQPNGKSNEAIPQLNALEQYFTRFAILAMQQTGKSQPIFYDPIAWEDKKWIYELIDRSYPYNQSREERPDENVVDKGYEAFMWVFDGDYTPKTLYFLLKLLKIDGDFNRLREETTNLLESETLEQEMETVIKAAIAEYFSYNFVEVNTWSSYAYKAEVDLALMMAYFKGLYQKFGVDVALQFFYNDSHDEASYYYKKTHDTKSGYTLGFEGMDCKQTNSKLGGTTDCDDNFCTKLGADTKGEISNKTLCCVEVKYVDSKKKPTFRKFVVKGSGSRYTKYGYGTNVTVDGFQEPYIDILDTNTVSEIGINEPCQ